MQKKVSMEEIAQKLGITRNTVSLVLRNMPGISSKTRELVIETAKELGYEYKTTSKKSDGTKTTTHSICLIQSKNTYDTNGFFSFIQLGIESEAKKNNLNLILHVYDDESMVFDLPICIKEGIAIGIITIGEVKKHTAKTLQKSGLPFVMADHYVEDIYTDCVLSDNHCGGFIGTQYLIDNGHKEIGFSGDISAATSFYDRYKGFKKALEINNIKPNNDYLLTKKCMSRIINSGLGEVISELEKLPKLPSAFFCCNDIEALSIIKALEIMGFSVPEDISIVGFDNIDSSKTSTPTLTTLNVQKEQMGIRAVQMLLSRLSNINAPIEKIILSTAMIERNSVRNIL